MPNRTRSLVLVLCYILLLQTAGYGADRARIAVIGSGGSGTTTAWLLDEDHDVVLYEVQDRLGGHSRTIDVDLGGTIVPVDAGFEFISDKFFPYFFNLLDNVLKLPLRKYTNFSTFYQTDTEETLTLPPIVNGKVEWQSLKPHNVFTMLEFNHTITEAKKIIDLKDVGITLTDFVNSLNLTDGFKNDFLYPFLAAGWGVSKTDIMQFAAYNAMKYVVEGDEVEDYQWLEITGGTNTYIQALVKQFVNAKVILSANITDLRYEGGAYQITQENGDTNTFDHVVIATNASDAANLLKNIPEKSDLSTLLGQIRYFDTTIAIHGDRRFMPKKMDDWAVVNVRYDGVNSATTVYKKWQSPLSEPIFKSWLTFDVRSHDDTQGPMPSPLYGLAYFQHPIADLTYFQVQKALQFAQGKHNLWFAGNYTHDNDSHESAIVSAINVAKTLAPESQRLNALTAIQP